MVHLLRKRWRIPTVKINGTAANPSRWPDGSYSVQGVATILGITPQTIFKWLRKGRLAGRQLAKGMPWQSRCRPSRSKLSEPAFESVERRFRPVDRLPTPIEWLSDNGSPYTARDTRALARA